MPKCTKSTLTKARDLRSNSTDAERRLWYLLRSRRFSTCKFRRQHPIDRYIVDFACVELRLIIELDGGQHQNQMREDRVRDFHLSRMGFRVLRFWNNDVMNNLAGVVEEIAKFVPVPPSPPAPLPLPRARGATSR